MHLVEYLLFVLFLILLFDSHNLICLLPCQIYLLKQLVLLRLQHLQSVLQQLFILLHDLPRLLDLVQLPSLQALRKLPGCKIMRQVRRYSCTHKDCWAIAVTLAIGVIDG